MPGVLQDIQDFMSSPEVTSRAELTKVNYRQTLNTHVYNFLKKTYPANYMKIANEAVDWQAFITYLTEEVGLSGQSTQQHIKHMRVWYKWKYQKHFNVSFRLSNGDIKAFKQKHLKRWFDERDIAQCLAYQFEKFKRSPVDSTKYRILVRLMVETGARVRELAMIECKNIEIEDCMVWLMDSKTEPRCAFFSPQTQVLFESLKASSLLWEGKLFPGDETIKKVIADMLVDLGLKTPKDGRGPHTFRHFLASKLFYVGKMRIEDIAFLLGDSVSTIVETYLHPTPLMLREIVANAMGWEMET